MQTFIFLSEQIKTTSSKHQRRGLRYDSSQGTPGVGEVIVGTVSQDPYETGRSVCRRERAAASGSAKVTLCQKQEQDPATQQRPAGTSEHNIADHQRAWNTCAINSKKGETDSFHSPAKSLR